MTDTLALAADATLAAEPRERADELAEPPSMPTASALERTIRCPDSWVLPHVQASGEYAARGVAIAAYVRRVVGGMPRPEASGLVPDKAWRKTCDGIDFADLCGDLTDVRGEMMYALDVERWTVRELGSNRGRRYPRLGPTEIGGTNDLEGVRVDDVQVVVDIKSGSRVTAAEENPQILYHAAARHLRTGSAVVQGRLAYIAEDGGVEVDAAPDFGPFDLESFGDDLRSMVRSVAASRERLGNGGPPRVSAGDWCKYCPAMVACPRFTALARRMLGDLQQIDAALGAMTPTEQGRAWQRAKEAESLVEHILGGLRAIAESDHPIPLPDGRVVKAVPWGTSHFARDKALTMLRERGVSDDEIRALTVKGKTVQVRPTGSRAKALPTGETEVADVGA